MSEQLREFLRFLDRSPTSWHAAKRASERLAEADFIPLEEGETWHLEAGKGYFVLRDDSALCAFRMPKSSLKGAIVLASHLDSPALKIKPVASLGRYGSAQFATEIYGSPLLHTWLDRNVALAGRVFVKTSDGSLESHLVHLDDYPFIIPSLALHLDRSISEKGLLLNKQDQLNPIAALSEHRIPLEKLLARHLFFQELLSFDLFLIPLEKASFAGVEGELICAHKLDNLTSAFAALDAMAKCRPSEHAVQLAIFWDHEEVGSKTHLGAESHFAEEVLERISLQHKMKREEFFQFKSRSLCLSCDLAHALHPNFSDKYDVPNAPRLGEGVVLKTNAMQRYATSASTAAQLLQIADRHGIHLQSMASRSDIPSGSTVGPMMASVTGIATVDLGIGSWAMHSARETVSAKDQLSLGRLLHIVIEEYAPAQ